MIKTLLSSKSTLLLVALPIAIGLSLLSYSIYTKNKVIEEQKKEIIDLNIQITQQLMHISALETDKRIQEQTSELEFKLTTQLGVLSEKIDHSFDQIDKELTNATQFGNSPSNKVDNSHQKISQSVIQSIWSGYKQIEHNSN